MPCLHASLCAPGTAELACKPQTLPHALHVVLHPQTAGTAVCRAWQAPGLQCGVQGLRMQCFMDRGGYRSSAHAQVVYHWAKGVAFKEICSLTDVLEGSIVRTIVRLDETCRCALHACHCSRSACGC